MSNVETMADMRARVHAQVDATLDQLEKELHNMFRDGMRSSLVCARGLIPIAAKYEMTGVAALEALIAGVEEALKEGGES